MLFGCCGVAILKWSKQYFVTMHVSAILKVNVSNCHEHLHLGAGVCTHVSIFLHPDLEHLQ